MEKENTYNQEPLNEGIVGNIFKGILIAPFAIIAGLVVFGSIYLKIEDMVYNHKAKKDRDKLELLSKSRNLLVKNIDKLLSNAKFAKYKPEAITMMNELTDLIEKYDKDLEALDNKFYRLSTYDEYKKNKSYFEKEYKTMYSKCKDKYDEISNKYKKSNSDWVEGLDIIEPLRKYIKLINNIYWRNTAGDDWWEAVKLFNDAWRKGIESDDPIWNDIYLEMYDTFTEFPDSINDFCNFKLPFSMIKIQFTGKSLNESSIDKTYIANLLLEAADLLDESAGANGLSRKIFKESDEYISKKDYDAKKAVLLKKQSHAVKSEDIAKITSQIKDLDKKRSISRIIVDKASEKDLIKENKTLSDDIKKGESHKTRDFMGRTNVHDTLDARSAHQIDPNFKTGYDTKREPVYRDEKDPRICYSGRKDLETMNKMIGKSKALTKVDKLNKQVIEKDQENERKTSAVNRNINRRANNESVEYMTLMLEAADLLDD